MTIAELLFKLRSLDVKIWADNGQLRCDTPKGVLTPELRAALNGHKAEILALLQEASSVGQRRQPPMQPGRRDGDLPLSFAQQRLWFIDQLEPNSSLYNIAKAFHIRGALQLAALEQSLNEIIRRHEVLRTTFRSVDGQPLQRIASWLTIPFTILDLTDCPEKERQEKALRLVNKEACRPFVLADGPLLRALVVRLAADDHILLLTMHHIVSDGWSMGILCRELSALYDGYNNGRPSRLDPLPVQYADFAQWQRDWLKGEVLQSQVDYWKDRIANIPTLQLPTDRSRPAMQSYRGARQSTVLADELCQALKDLSQKERASLFMTLVAAFNVLLCRYSGQEDVVIGTPIAGRNRSEVEGLIGFFVNTLVLRTDLSGDPTFRELLSRVRNGALDAYAHQDLPFEKLVEEMGPQRNLSYAPLSQVMFAFQNFPDSPLTMSDCSVHPVDLDSGTAKFDLTLQISRESHGMRCVLTYNTDLFYEQTIARMLGNFKALLEAVVVNPDRRVSELEILTEAERHQLLIEWNGTKRDYPINKCIPKLIEEQVERTPDEVAVVFPSPGSRSTESQKLTYRELNIRANQLAHYLRRQGVGPEVLVALCVERSLEMIIGLLGIVKAGAAYVPLDPSYPKERLAFILQDAGAKVLLSQRRLVLRLPQHNAKLVCLDADQDAIGRESESNPGNGAEVEQIAYVIYTSGSTGKPKGVAIEHRSTVALLHWASQVLPKEDISGMLASTSISFDLSVFEIFVPLSWGGKVILAEDALQLPTLPGADEVTLINTVPSAMAELLRLGGVPSSVRKVCLAGEALTTQLVRQIHERESISSVVDLYGPSEDTTYSTFAVRSSLGPATIGRPISNTQVYILDDHLNPVPRGVRGELYLGGDGLARGYLNRPELTAEKFIPNRFSEEPGARLYKTGDLARYLSDGNIEFLGRIDHQVKIRGFRIELGEIEAVIKEHAAVRDAVVVAREDVAGDKRLVGYVINREPVQVSDLRKYLQAKLPDYMVPWALVFLDFLPLTPNGKIDREALPAPDHSRPELENTFVAPRTHTEHSLAKIWAELLVLERVGVYDNFFDIGGHSLLATQVVSRLRAAVGIDVPLRTLFEFPTVASLAERIETVLWAAEDRAADFGDTEEFTV
jgi:amino acid adenylation domain-containing protein